MIALRLLALHLAVFTSSCDLLESSEYTKDPKYEEEISKTKVDDNPEETLATGVPKCINDHYDKNDKEAVTPPQLSKTLADNFQSTDAIQSVADWTDLVDLLWRENVTPTGQVDYANLAGPRKDQFTLAVNKLSELPVPSSTLEDEIAYWTNVYNVLMVSMIIEHDLKDVSEKFDVFKQKHNISTHSLSLDQIEKGILILAGGKEDHPSELTVEKPIEKLHFALVCAAISCPKLRNFAYREEIMSEMLEENMLMFFNSTTHISSANGVKVSNLFSWFPEDFDELAGGIQGFYRRNLIEAQVIDGCRDDKEVLAQAFEDNEFKALGVIAYDWSVNSK